MKLHWVRSLWARSEASLQVQDYWYPSFFLWQSLTNSISALRVKLTYSLRHIASEDENMGPSSLGNLDLNTRIAEAKNYISISLIANLTWCFRYLYSQIASASGHLNVSLPSFWVLLATQWRKSAFLVIVLGDLLDHSLPLLAIPGSIQACQLTHIWHDTRLAVRFSLTNDTAALLRTLVFMIAQLALQLGSRTSKMDGPMRLQWSLTRPRVQPPTEPNNIMHPDQLRRPHIIVTRNETQSICRLPGTLQQELIRDIRGINGWKYVSLPSPGVAHNCMTSLPSETSGASQHQLGPH